MSGLLLFITIVSVAVACAASALAWRMARDERLRSEARVRLLAPEIHGSDETPVAVHDMFGVDPPARVPVHLTGAAAAGVVVVGAAVVLALAAGGPSDSVAADRAPADGPLTLTALQHTREGRTLTIRGRVLGLETPGEGEPAVTAVVSALDGDGRVVATGHGPLVAAGGVESTFSVVVSGDADPRRYRVGFRRADRTIAHLDRRDRASFAQESGRP